MLRGIEGTIYEGLVLGHVARHRRCTGEAADSITISTTLGIAEILFQDIEANISLDGVITDQISLLQEQNSNFSAEIAAIDERLALVERSLIEKYAQLEQSLASADATANQLQAFINASNRNR